MEVNKQDNLFDLIKSLSKAEKRNFKLYATRQAGNSDAKFISLFDALDSIDRYDEKKILKRCPVSKSQLPNMKAHLYRQILVSVRLINVQHNISIQLREQIDFARILYDKGLYKQSLKVLDKTKKIAMVNEQTTTALEVVEFEKSIEILHITRSITSRAEQLSKQTTDLCHSIDNVNELTNISIQLYSLYLKLGYIRSERDLGLVVKFFKPKLEKYNKKECSFVERIHLYQALMWYAYISYDFLSCYKYSRKVVELFEDNPHLCSLFYDQYLKGYSRFLETLFLMRSYKRLTQTMTRYRKVVEDVSIMNDHAVILSHIPLYSYEISIHFIEGTFNEGIALVPKIEAFLDKYSSNIDIHHKLLFYYKIACLYFGDAQYSKCMEYLQLIINSRDPQVRRDLQCFSRILNLIASYESHEDYNFDYQIRSTYHYIVKMNDMHDVQKEMITFFKRLNSVVYASDVKRELKSLYDRLLPYESHPYERRPFFYLDIISWLESKLQGVKVSTIIQQKFREKYL